MPAKLIAYRDKECTQELLRSKTTGAFVYTFFSIDESGAIVPAIDGIKGDEGTFSIYVKNIGTRAALRPRLTFESVNYQFLLDQKELTADDISIGGVASFDFSFKVKSWTASQVNTTTFTLDYYSLPDTTPEANPYNQYMAIGLDTNLNAHIEEVE